MGRKIDLESVPEILEWISLPEAAQRLEVSRQQVHRMAATGKFESLSRIGTYLVVSSEEILNMSLERAIDKGEPLGYHY